MMAVICYGHRKIWKSFEMYNVLRTKIGFGKSESERTLGELHSAELKISRIFISLWVSVFQCSMEEKKITEILCQNKEVLSFEKYLVLKIEV